MTILRICSSLACLCTALIALQVQAQATDRSLLSSIPQTPGAVLNSPGNAVQDQVTVSQEDVSQHFELPDNSLGVEQTLPVPVEPNCPSEQTDNIEQEGLDSYEHRDSFGSDLGVELPGNGIERAPTPVFVHRRQTVPVSQRTAEIWFKLPENAFISVNFIEYPPEGTFRIFKTKLNSLAPRRYYIDAWCSCLGNCGRKSLVASRKNPRIGIDDSGFRFVDLMPGDRVVIDFSRKQDCPLVEGILVPRSNGEHDTSAKGDTGSATEPGSAAVPGSPTETAPSHGHSEEVTPIPLHEQAVPHDSESTEPAAPSAPRPSLPVMP